MEGGSLLKDGTSRMNREVHVRICGRLGAKSPRAYPASLVRWGKSPDSRLISSVPAFHYPRSRTGLLEEIPHISKSDHGASKITKNSGALRITIFEVVLHHPCEVAIPLIARKSCERAVALHA